MPRCIVVGCTSGYISNPEKVHFFYVPKDENIRKQWQTALRRKDITIKSTQAVCHHHFVDSDILWKREICDEKGNVLGMSAPFKIPRLRKGTVPSQFPWFEEILVNSKDNTDSDKNIQNEMYVGDELNQATIFSFDEVLNIINKNKLNMPNQWVHAQYCDGITRLLIFFLAMCKKLEKDKNIYSFNSIKEVILKDDMTLQINILKQPVLNLPSSIQFYNTINSIDQLQETLFSVDNLYICCGANESQNYIENVEYNEAFKDVSDTWRHKKCILFSTSKLDKCKFCAVIKNSVNQKRRRAEKTKSMENSKIKTTLRKQNKILLLRKKCYKAQKARNRAKYMLHKLKKELVDNVTEMKAFSMKNIENQLKETNISPNELIAIQEIIKAAKQENTKGRRYNEEWILLCLLLHMKSPKAYEFLRDTQILPIPCIRTIRRYLSLIDTPCGFDTNFFKMFEVALQKKKDIQKHGVILLDEVHLRESINVNSKNLTYTGLIDFGNQLDFK